MGDARSGRKRVGCSPTTGWWYYGDVFARCPTRCRGSPSGWVLTRDSGRPVAVVRRCGAEAAAALRKYARSVLRAASAAFALGSGCCALTAYAFTRADGIETPYGVYIPQFLRLARTARGDPAFGQAGVERLRRDAGEGMAAGGKANKRLSIAVVSKRAARGKPARPPNTLSSRCAPRWGNW